MDDLEISEEKQKDAPSGRELVDERSGADRRRLDVPPPGGVDRRQWQDRRKLRASEGRERYMDMVQRERAMFLEHGVARSTDQLLDMAGAVSASGLEEESSIKDRATGDQLRSVLPVQAWLPLSIHLIGLKDGVLTIAPLNELNER